VSSPGHAPISVFDRVSTRARRGSVELTRHGRSLARDSEFGKETEMAIANKLEDGAETTGRVAGYAEEAADKVKAAAGEAVDRVTAAAKDAIDDPERFAKESYDSIATYAREKPLEALAIGAAVGFVLGAIWKR
jgi:ElaB/YqjD/DUF883 family membrane-anchored ribosome-binding protein